LIAVLLFNQRQIQNMTTSHDSRATTLGDRLRERIKHAGPMTFHDWMEAALYDEQDGYYLRPDRARQGKAGDYRTAPETSPLFAAIFASYFSSLFINLHLPIGLTIFESGAGSGHFAYGILEKLRRDVPEVFAVTNYVIDEISAAARKEAAERLTEFSDRVTFRHLDEIETTNGAGIVFTNELIDAFPVHRVILRGGVLRELYVALDGGRFVWIDGALDEAVADYCGRIDLELREGQIAEINLAAAQFIDRSARLFDRGYLITVDYGAERDELLSSPDRFRGTLRAFRRHQMMTDPLAKPGEQDLTTTIDWTQVIEAGWRAGFRTLCLDRLDQFLLKEGSSLIGQIANSTANAAESLRLLTNARELILPTGLAASFQVCVQEKLGFD
jgi:SAM-dependent MidA family methyltransferase